MYVHWDRLIGWEISGMCVKPNFFHSILIFMLDVWGGGFKIQKYRNTGVFFELTRVDNGIGLNIV